MPPDRPAIAVGLGFHKAFFGYRPVDELPHLNVWHFDHPVALDLYLRIIGLQDRNIRQRGINQHGRRLPTLADRANTSDLHFAIFEIDMTRYFYIDPVEHIAHGT